MKDFVLTCTSTCDLNPYFLREHNIYYVSFFYYINENKFYDDFYKEHNITDYYNLLDNNDVKTSQPDPNQYKELWLKLIDQGKDILHIELSSGISGAINSALIAKSMVNEIRNDAKIYVVDSLCCSTGYGLLLDKVSEYIKSDYNIDNAYNYAEQIKNNINHLFVVSDINQLIKGGRISKVSGGIGKALNIIPILHVSSSGKLEVIKKVRGIKNVLSEILNISKTNIKDANNYNDKLFFNFNEPKQNVLDLSNIFKNEYVNAKISEDYFFDIGTVIGAHTGKGTFSVFYIGKGRI